MTPEILEKLTETATRCGCVAHRNPQESLKSFGRVALRLLPGLDSTFEATLDRLGDYEFDFEEEHQARGFLIAVVGGLEYIAGGRIKEEESKDSAGSQTPE